MRVFLCYSVTNLFLAVIVICLNAFFFMYCLTFNHHTFNLTFTHLHIALMVCFKVNFLLTTIKHYLILCYVNDVPDVFSKSDLKALTVYICQHSGLH